MAIGAAPVVVAPGAPDYAQHLVTDVNNAIARLAQAVAPDDLAAVQADVDALEADFATLTPLAFSASGADIVNATIPNAKFSETATTAVPGPVELATAVEVNAATDNTRAVTPLGVVAHPGVAKAWGTATGAGGALQAAYNLTSLTRTGTGAYDVVIATDFGGAEYIIVPSVDYSAAVLVVQVLAGKTAGTFTLAVNSIAGTPTDPDRISFVCFGTQ